MSDFTSDQATAPQIVRVLSPPAPSYRLPVNTCPNYVKGEESPPRQEKNPVKTITGAPGATLKIWARFPKYKQITRVKTPLPPPAPPTYPQAHYHLPQVTACPILGRKDGNAPTNR